MECQIRQAQFDFRLTNNLLCKTVFCFKCIIINICCVCVCDYRLMSSIHRASYSFMTLWHYSSLLHFTSKQNNMYIPINKILNQYYYTVIVHLCIALLCGYLKSVFLKRKQITIIIIFLLKIEERLLQSHTIICNTYNLEKLFKNFFFLFFAIIRILLMMFAIHHTHTHK